MDEVQEFININTDVEDNIAIEYDCNSLDDPSSVMMVELKIIWWTHERESWILEERKRKQIRNYLKWQMIKSVIMDHMVFIIQFSCDFISVFYDIFIFFFIHLSWGLCLFCLAAYTLTYLVKTPQNYLYPFKTLLRSETGIFAHPENSHI